MDISKNVRDAFQARIDEVAARLDSFRDQKDRLQTQIANIDVKIGKALEEQGAYDQFLKPEIDSFDTKNEEPKP